MVGRLRALLGVMSIALGACSADEADEAERGSVLVTTELGMRWDLVPHRVSFFELAFEGDADAREGTVFVENEGGPLGAIDTAHSRQAFTRFTGPGLRSVPLSVQIEIPGPGTTEPDDFVATADARTPGDALEGADALVAWIRGFRISTDEYETPPPFASDPDLPYLPAEGFTTQGLGIGLGEPMREGAEIVVPVSVRNSLGPADRGDMNAAIPQASSWVRVDLVIVGVRGAKSVRARAAVEYTSSTASYGQNTVHEHATPELQALTVAGEPNVASAMAGFASFDWWINAPSKIDPACQVVTDPINAWGEPISGPGRYLTELSVRAWDHEYDPASGVTSARVDLFFSNSSTVKEIGNLCVGARAEISVLQTTAPVTALPLEPIELDLPRGDRRVEPVSWP